MMARPSSPLSILIVEDEALVAMDIEAMVEDSGHRVVGEAASLDEVAALDVMLRPDLVLLDVQLARGSSGLDVCALVRRRWADAFIFFITANPKKLPEDFCGGHGVIPKPFSRSGLSTALRYIAEGVIDPPPRSSQPTSFIASPHFAATWEKKPH